MKKRLLALLLAGAMTLSLAACGQKEAPAASAPAASSATMFAEQYDCDARYVSRVVAISTIISIITMPLMIMLV